MSCPPQSQASHSSFGALPLLLPFMADVPIALGFGRSADFPKLSQKSFLVSSSGACRVELSPSTNRLKLSVAPLAPVCAVFASCSAVFRACVARSASASYIDKSVTAIYMVRKELTRWAAGVR